MQKTSSIRAKKHVKEKQKRLKVVAWNGLLRKSSLLYSLALKVETKITFETTQMLQTQQCSHFY